MGLLRDRAAGDPRSARLHPDGAHAVATLLRDRGVAVERVETAEAVAFRPGSTVFVPVAAALTPDELHRLAGAPGPIVVVGADERRLAVLAPGVTDAPDVEVADRRPACDLLLRLLPATSTSVV